MDLHKINFWKRLEMFAKDVQVNDAMSEEEKEMIVRIAKDQQKLNIASVSGSASGAVDTVAAGKPTWRDECASAGEDCGCGAICMFAPSARKSSEGQP